MRAIRILFAIFSFSIFSHDLQLRSSDLFRFSAADLGGLDDHRDCGRIVLDGLVAHFLGLLPHGLASAFAALHGLAEVLGTTADGHVSAGIEQLLGNGTDAAVFLELAGEAALERVVGAAVGLALRAVAATLGGVRFEHGRGGVLAGAASAPSVATEAIAAIAPLRAFRLLIFFSSFFSLCCIAISTPGFANQLPRRFGRTKRELSSSQSEHLSQILFPSTIIPNTP